MSYPLPCADGWLPRNKGWGDYRYHALHVQASTWAEGSLASQARIHRDAGPQACTGLPNALHSPGPFRCSELEGSHSR